MFKNILDLPQVTGYSANQNIELFYSIQYTVKSIDERYSTTTKVKAIAIYEALDDTQLSWLYDIGDRYQELQGNQVARIIFAQDCVEYVKKAYELDRDINNKYNNLTEDLPF
jgi:hypothetical protein